MNQQASHRLADQTGVAIMAGEHGVGGDVTGSPVGSLEGDLVVLVQGSRPYLLGECHSDDSNLVIGKV